MKVLCPECGRGLTLVKRRGRPRLGLRLYVCQNLLIFRSARKDNSMHGKPFHCGTSVALLMAVKTQGTSR